MKIYLWGFVLLLIFGTIAFLISQFPSTELIVILNPWEIHASIGFVVFLLFAAFMASSVLKKSSRWLWSWREKWGERRQRKAQQAIQHQATQGLVAYLEGRFDEAEKLLAETAPSQSTPAIHYLLAAQAAHAKGRIAERNEFLLLAESHLPEAEYGLSYLQADYYLQDGASDQSLSILEAMHAVKPGDLRVSKILISLYEKQHEGTKLLQLLSGPSQKGLRHALGDRTVDDLEDKAAHWLSLQHQGADRQTVQSCLALLPKRLQKNSRWLSLHFPQHNKAAPRRSLFQLFHA